jgi:hypothetical protein
MTEIECNAARDLSREIIALCFTKLESGEITDRDVLAAVLGAFVHTAICSTNPMADPDVAAEMFAQMTRDAYQASWSANRGH